MSPNPRLAVPMLRYLAVGVALGDAARGVRETSPNWGPDVRAYLANCDPPIKVPSAWCAAAVQSWTDKAARAAGVPNPLDAVEGEAYVLDYFRLAQARGWVIAPSMADTGDLILYQFEGGPRRWNHIGLVVQPPDRQGLVHTVEGNTGDPSKNQRDGDGVYQKVRSIRSSYQTCFIRWDRDVAIPADAPPLQLAA